MSYPFVQAKHYTPGAMRQVRAVVWHMAEGGNTVAYLRRTTRNVSAHFVVEYTGRIVQMVRESDASHHCSGRLNHSSNPASDSGIYGFEHARAVLGSDAINNINVYTLSVEIEGFAKYGPNNRQADAMQALYADLRRRFPTQRGALGHRDVTEIKPCPGRFIPWSRLGGHGLWTPAEPEEDDVFVSTTEWCEERHGTLPPNTRSFAAVPPYQELGVVSGPATFDAEVSIDQTGTPHGTFWRLVTGPSGRRLVAKSAVIADE